MGPRENNLNAVANVADERLLIEAAQHDPSRFAELYENNFERVYAYVVRRVHSREEAEDITAEVFHQALLNIGRFEWRGVPFAAWLLRIAPMRWQTAGSEPPEALKLQRRRWTSWAQTRKLSAGPCSFNWWTGCRWISVW